MHSQMTLQSASKVLLKYPAPSLQRDLSAQLIINADDFGANSDINAAIVSCFEKNLINSTTIMANMEGFEEAVKLASVHGLKNNIGLHVNLTQGKPLTDLSGTGLTDEHGNFIAGKIFAKPGMLLPQSTRSKIKKEIEAQYHKVIKSGIYPTHIDSHQHVHTLPLLAPIFIEFVKEHNQKLRLVAIKKKKNIFMTAFYLLMNAYCRRNRIHFTDTFGNVKFFMKYLREKKVNRVFEIMVHPTYKGSTIIDFLEHTDLEKSLTTMIKLYNQKCVTNKITSSSVA
jgi:predicted glycoside hydrolase/deacetylase ChbG (UPF0249 family)